MSRISSTPNGIPELLSGWKSLLLVYVKWPIGCTKIIKSPFMWLKMGSVIIWEMWMICNGFTITSITSINYWKLSNWMVWMWGVTMPGHWWITLSGLVDTRKFAKKWKCPCLFVHNNFSSFSISVKSLECTRWTSMILTAHELPRLHQDFSRKSRITMDLLCLEWKENIHIVFWMLCSFLAIWSRNP